MLFPPPSPLPSPPCFAATLLVFGYGVLVVYKCRQFRFCDWAKYWQVGDTKHVQEWIRLIATAIDQHWCAASVVQSAIPPVLIPPWALSLWYSSSQGGTGGE